MQWHCNPPPEERRDYGQKVESLIAKNEAIIALEKRTLDILDRECASEEDDDCYF
jgi:hypothetical protein